MSGSYPCHRFREVWDAIVGVVKGRGHLTISIGRLVLPDIDQVVVLIKVAGGYANGFREGWRSPQTQPDRQLTLRSRPLNRCNPSSLRGSRVLIVIEVGEKSVDMFRWGPLEERFLMKVPGPDSGRLD